MSEQHEVRPPTARVPHPSKLNGANGHLAADRDELTRFVDCLFRYADAGTFASLRAFDQTDATKPPILIRGVQVNGDLRILSDAAAKAVHDIGTYPSATVFCPPIATFSNPKQARADDLANGLTISVELDAGDIQAARTRLTELLGPPTVVMESGGEFVDEWGEVHAKLHMHWRLSEPTRDADDHASLNLARTMAAMLVGADPTGAPAVHPYRWAGSWNLKATPRLAHTVEENDGAEVHLTEALAALTDAVEAAGIEASKPHISSEPTAATARLASAMAAIPNEGQILGHYDMWIRSGYAVHAATAGAGYDIWDAWSQKSEKYNSDQNVAAWKRIGSAKPSRIGAGTIIFYAKAAGWQEPPLGLFQPTAASGATVDPSAFFDPWEEPAPPDWPMGILDPQIEQMVSQVSVRDGLDYGALCAAHIAAASGAAPKNIRFFPYADGALETNWWVPPIIWFMLINESGQRKTQIKQIAFGRLVRINASLWRDYCQRLDEWNAKSEDEKHKAGKPVTPHTFVADDVSVEAMQMILARNPRGTLYLKDELAAFFEFGRYAGAGKGQAERAYYLETYEAHPKNVSRVGRDPLFIETNGLTIFGSIQPTRLAEFKGLESDGLLQRFCQLLPRRSAISQPDIKIPDARMFEGVVERLTKLGAGMRPYTTNAEGAELIRRSEREASEFSEITDFGIGFQGWCSKMHGTNARLALILHLMGDTYGVRLIPPETIARARRLVRGYLLPHTREFYRTLPGSNMLLMRDIGAWLLTKAKDRFVASDVVAGVKAMRGMSTRDIAELLDPFVAGGWMEPETRFPNNKAWQIYPDVRTAFGSRTDTERVRLADIRAKIGRTANFDE